MSILSSVKYPNDVSGLLGWWDAADFNSLADGVDITTITDKTGNGRDFTYNAFPGTAAGFPKSKKYTTGKNRIVVRGNGKYDMNLDVPSNLPLTFFYVWKFNYVTLNNSTTFVMGCNSSNGTMFHVGTYITNMVSFQGGNGLLGPIVDNISYNQLSTVVSNTPAQRKLRFSGMDYSTVNAATLTGFNQLYLNSRSDTFFNPGEQDFCEMIVYSGILSTKDIVSIEKYLKFKWAL